MNALLKSVLTTAAWVGGAIFLGGCGVDVSAPTSYTVYHAKDGTFRCDCPDGWTVTPNGKQFHGTTFSLGNAEIRIRVGAIGPVSLDAASTDVAPGGKSADEGMPAVARVHDAERKSFSRHMTDYEELPAATVKTGLGDVCRAEFTMSDRVGGKMHGYRATALTGGKRVQIGCTCPESNWAMLRPAFDHVIESLRPGTAER